MEDQDQILVSALQKATLLVEGVEERYREGAFPIILQALINDVNGISLKAVMLHDTNQQEKLELRLPPNMSVNAFFLKAKPETHNARYVCAAYFLLHTGKSERVTLTDFNEIYEKLRKPKPKNPSDVIVQCIRKAHLTDGPSSPDKQKTWVITPEGEKYVEELLNDNAAGHNSTSH